MCCGARRLTTCCGAELTGMAWCLTACVGARRHWALSCAHGLWCAQVIAAPLARAHLGGCTPRP
eukprot:9417795-Pyramimonas_sp.AAC.1